MEDKPQVVPEMCANNQTSYHDFSPPVEMHYRDGDTIYPYAVSTCNACGFIVSKKL